MSKLLLALLALAFASTTASAVGDNAKQQGSGGDARHPPSAAAVAGSNAKQQNSGGDAKRQEIFLRVKLARVNAFSSRIAGIQSVLGCINGATSLEQMNLCTPQPSGGGSAPPKPCG